MVDIAKDNVLDFFNYYHNLHDSYITNINYDINKSQIELLIDVCWSGEPKLKEDNTYETNKTKLKIIFEKIEKLDIKEIFSWDYINSVSIKFITLEDKELISFTSDEDEPMIFIICEIVKYEELKITN